jgi:hypothetical protein
MFCLFEIRYHHAKWAGWESMLWMPGLLDAGATMPTTDYFWALWASLSSATPKISYHRTIDQHSNLSSMRARVIFYFVCIKLID